MALAIKSSRAIIETPKKGRAVELEVRFLLTKRVTENLTAAQIRAIAIKGTKAKIADIIKKGIRKEYKGSGLKRISGKLIAAAQRFKLNIRIFAPDVIFVTATWEPKLAYFFAHLFGVRIRITPKMRVFLHANDIIHPRASTMFVKIPRRNYLAIRKRIRQEISDKVFEPAFKRVFTKKVGRAEVAEIKKRLERKTGRRMSRFRERRIRETSEASRRGQTQRARIALGNLGAIPVRG